MNNPYQNQYICVVCDADNWAKFPTLQSNRSMTTAGRYVDAPLGKAQCINCGSIQKVYEKRLADTSFYEDEYTYYARPGSEKFDTVRYEALAEWMVSAIKEFSPRRVLDIGCGRGSTISALAKKIPTATFIGIDPTHDAVKTANENGMDVRQGRLNKNNIQMGKFDLIYSNNVLQHTTDPVEFLKDHSHLLESDGLIVLTCPDGSTPSIELMMADQNFSFSPNHLTRICKKAGFVINKWLPCPGGPLRHEQLIVLSKNLKSSIALNLEGLPKMAELKRFIEYHRNWSTLDNFLCEKTVDKKRIFNFGGGLWSYVLAAYCPNYWATVESCLVDGFYGTCIDKPVIPTDQASLCPEDAIVLGTNPYVQEKLIQRFSSQKLYALAVDHIIPD